VNLYRANAYRQHFMTPARVHSLRNGHIVEKFKCVVRETGLVIDKENPFMGGSPDGLVETNTSTGKALNILLEIKCPKSSVPYSAQEKYKKQMHPMVPAGIPPQYYAQIQGVMGIMKLPACDFVVMTVPETGDDVAAAVEAEDADAPALKGIIDTKLDITRYPFDSKFYNEFLLPGIKKWYWGMYAPALRLKMAGKLEKGQVPMK
jgi:hypothetical protein